MMADETGTAVGDTVTAVGTWSTEQSTGTENTELVLGNGEIGTKKVESSLLAEKKQRGRPWQPGQSGNPNGRPTKAQELALLAAITSAFTPEEVTAHLQQAMGFAIKHESAGGVIAVLEFQADRTAGKPGVRIPETGTSFPEIVAMFLSRSPD